MQIHEIAVLELHEYENNPRNNDGAVEAVAASIEEFGFKVPIIIDSDNTIVAGHTRVKAARKLGMSAVPCIIADDLTPEQIKAFRLADNKTAELAEWDFAKLETELAELANIEFDMSVFGFDLSDLGFEEEKEIIEDEVQEVDEENEPITKLGDIWQLGEHRLMCGDSTDAGTVAILMDGKKADLVFTDPPYGMNKEKDGVLNDNLNYDDLLEFNKQWIPLSFDALKENGSWYCWGIDEPLMDIYAFILKPIINENKITFRNLITWDKGSAQGQLSSNCRMYPTADEKCLFVMCGVQGFNTNTDNYFDGWESVRFYLETEAKKAKIGAKEIKEICGVGMYGHWFTKSQWQLLTEEHYLKIQDYCKANGIEAFKREYEEVKREYYATRAYFDNTHDNMNNVWHFGRTSGEERELTGGHATPKPIALCSRAIKSSSRGGEIVLDLFGGSGSTIIACEQLGRTCYMMELDPKYCDVIIKRWETLTGEKAVKIN